MTYKETLDWMFAQLPMYQQKGKTAYRAKLDGITSFAEHLNNPHHHFKSIHVAGTNGKGSSSHMLASIAQEAGYKVGLYTSPHLKDFRERIRINGKTTSKQFVVDFIAENKTFFASKSLSFFEMTVGMAFDYFSKEKVDLAIIEVGLGGRLDSTNIIIPEVSLITNIGYDHMDILGGSLDKIAFEKAGIIKENVPVVISEHQMEIASVFETIAKSKNCNVVFADNGVYSEFETDLLGVYQQRNIKGVLAAIYQLKSFSIDEVAIRDGLLNVVENTGLMGRWQILQHTPKIICDTAHNYEGLVLVVQQLLKESFKELHIVLGFVEDKKLEAILPTFPKQAHYYFCKPNILRGLEVDKLVVKALEYGLNGRTFPSVSDAYKSAKTQAKEDDLVFVGGSTFVVAEVV